MNIEGVFVTPMEAGTLCFKRFIVKFIRFALSPVEGCSSIFQDTQYSVIPAKAEIQFFRLLQHSWTPVFTGVTFLSGSSG